MDLLDGYAASEKLCDAEDIVTAEGRDVVKDLFVRHIVKLCVVYVINADLERAHTLEKCLLEIRADAHDLARRLHLSSELIGCGRELIEGESGELRDDVVELGLECCVSVCDLDLLKCHTDCDLSSNARDRVARCLGCERGGTRNAGVDLDEIVLGRVGVECELYVTASLDLELLDELDRAVVEHLEVVVAECHNRSYDDRVTGVNADGVDVLHSADGDRVVCAVAHNLELDLLVALDALLDKDLMNGRESERVGADFDQLCFVVCKSAARAAESECRAENYGVAYSLCRSLSFLKAVGDLGGDYRLADRLTELLEELSVLCALDRLARRAEKLDAAFLKNALLLELYSEVEPGLTAYSGKNSVGTLVADDLCYIFKSERLHVDLVRDGRVGHDRRRVGVYENYLVALLLERKTRLRARIVEFSRLTDNDRAGAYDHYSFDVCSFCHFAPLY